MSTVEGRTPKVDERRPSRSAGSTRNKTRIGRILAEQQDAPLTSQGMKPVIRRKKSKKDLVNNLLSGVTSAQGQRGFFEKSALFKKQGKKGSSAHERKGSSALMKPPMAKQSRRPKSDENQRPKSEEHRRGGRKQSRHGQIRSVSLSSRKQRNSKCSTPTNTVKNKNRQFSAYAELEAELMGRSIESEKPLNPKASKKNKKETKKKNKSTENGAKFRASKNIHQVSNDRKNEGPVALGDIEKMQEQRRHELENYLSTLQSKVDIDGKPLIDYKNGDDKANEGNGTPSDDAEDHTEKNDSAKSLKMKEFGAAKEKPLNIKKILKKVEKEFNASYPEYDGTVSLKDGTMFNPLTKIEDFGSKIDSLLHSLGDVNTLGGAGMGFKHGPADLEAVDKLDVQLNQLRAMRPNTQTNEISNKARTLLHTLRKAMKDDKKNETSSVFGTDRTMLSELSKGMVHVDSDYNQIKMDPEKVKRLVDEAKKEMGAVFITEDDSLAENTKDRRKGSKQKPAVSDVKSKACSSKILPENPPADNSLDGLDAEAAAELSGMPNVLRALKKGNELKEYYPEVDLTRRPMIDGLNHLDKSIETLAQSETAKKLRAEAQIPESHKAPLASSKLLPPVRPPARVSTNPVDLMSKSKNLIGNIERKLEKLKTIEKYDL